MDARLQEIILDFNRGKMTLDNMKWLIQEVRESKDRIGELEKQLQLEKNACQYNYEQLELANELIDALEKFSPINQVDKKAPYDDPND